VRGFLLPLLLLPYLLLAAEPDTASPSKCRGYLLLGQRLEAADSLDAAREAYRMGFRWGLIEYTPELDDELAALQERILTHTSPDFVSIVDSSMTKDLCRVREGGGVKVPYWQLDSSPRPTHVPSFPWEVTRDEEGKRFNAVVSVHIDTTGSVIDTRLLMGSGNPAYDTCAMSGSYEATFTPPVWQGRKVETWYWLRCEASDE
jgi:TonB family protein